MKLEFLRNLRQNARVIVVTGCVLTIAVIASRAQSASPAPAPKTAEQQFKNIQVLKGVPAEQVIPTMQFISASLGVECNFCHVEHAFDKDDKKPKQFARHMIEMQNAINKNNFKGETEVTCNTCHRGNPHPVAIPAVADANWKPAPPQPETAHTAPEQSADPIIAKYMRALGGQQALKKVSSLTEKGTAEFNGRSIPVDIYAKAPDARVSYMHMPNGDSITGFDGKVGWLASPGRPVHEMTSSEAAGAKLDAIVTFPGDFAREFSHFRVGHPEKIDDRAVTLLFAMHDGQPPVRLFFDDQSGLLVRMIRLAETPLGRTPTQIDYADYREVNGVKTPFQWTISRPASRFTIKLTEAKINSAVDPSKFVRPPDPPPPAQAH